MDAKNIQKYLTWACELLFVLVSQTFPSKHSERHTMQKCISYSSRGQDSQFKMMASSGPPKTSLSPWVEFGCL